jgi:hypothetical protein
MATDTHNGKRSSGIAFHALLLLVASTYAGTVGKPSAATAQDKTVTCTGTLVDVWIKKNADWPLAVIYDADGKRTCSIDRSGSGHDPMQPCSAGEKCRITGTYRLLGIGDEKTYSIQTITDINTGG